MNFHSSHILDYIDYILRFGTAGKFLPEQGREFENNLFTHLSKLCNMVEMDMIKLIVNMIDMDMIIDMRLDSYMCTSIHINFFLFIVLNSNYFGHIQIYFMPV